MFPGCREIQNEMGSPFDAAHAFFRNVEIDRFSPKNLPLFCAARGLGCSRSRCLRCPPALAACRVLGSIFVFKFLIMAAYVSSMPSPPRLCPQRHFALESVVELCRGCTVTALPVTYLSCSVPSYMNCLLAQCSWSLRLYRNQVPHHAGSPQRRRHQLRRQHWCQGPVCHWRQVRARPPQQAAVRVHRRHVHCLVQEGQAGAPQEGYVPPFCLICIVCR